ncbi:MAG: hypothetical protein HN509_01880 [Halobacteriovoraceae bacterium]|jgi:hypothetical protein|nr:hypothetical protein [Halobacteriovoraceae bacterium]MBT5094360.1 hypothetical protein [Halobacteriovoraceae bacterium]
MIKTALPSVFLIIFVYSFASPGHATFLEGGVDVGNGQITITGLATPIFSSEQKLVEYSQKLLERIKSGRGRRVADYQEQGSCDPAYAKFSNLAIRTRYPTKIGLVELFSKKQYRGHITVKLKDCLTGGEILDDSEPEYF